VFTPTNQKKLILLLYRNKSSINALKQLKMSDTTAPKVSVPKGKRMCRNGIDCTRADCWFVHPSDWAPPPKKRKGCRYGLNCCRISCRYEHPEGWSPVKQKKKVITIPSRIVIPAKTICRYGIDCHRIDCKFDHPEGWNPIVPKVPKPKRTCRFGLKCHRIDCKFEHPSGWDPIKLNKVID